MLGAAHITVAPFISWYGNSGFHSATVVDVFLLLMLGQEMSLLFFI